MRARRRGRGAAGVGASLLLAVALATGAACAGDATERERRAADPAPNTGPAGDAQTTGAGAVAPRLIASEKDGFSVEIPSGWKEILVNTETLQRILAEGSGGGKLDGAIANQIRTLAGRGGKLFAYDEARRTTNLNVLKLPSTPGSTLEAVAEALPAQLAEAGLRDVQVETVTLPAGPAARAVGTQAVQGAGGRHVDLLQLQYYVVRDNDLFVVILATDDPARDRGTLEGIAQTFTLL